MPNHDPGPLAASGPAPATAERSAPGRAAEGAPPARIGARYDVIREIGRGGMGAVYHVRETTTGRELALKQLLAASDERAGARLTAAFEREYYRLAQLCHPHVIQVHDYGVDTRGPFYTMELLAGGDLKERAPLDYRTACALMLDVCSCLSLLHSRRLVHRDISPRNIRCTQDGHAKLIDFGATVPIGPCLNTVGTPAFVAPEVVHRLVLDARTDLFSLGATLYFTLTGRIPFAAREFSELRQAWAHKPVPASEYAKDVPAALDALLSSLLSIDPAKRPRTAFEVSQRLAAIAGIDRVEPLAASRAYLSTPSMVGRDTAIHAFRHSMRAARDGQGGGMLFESLPGLGRSRMLDACTLEAKTAGAIVVRANARAGAETAFAAAEQLAEQLLEALPEASRQAAHAAGVADILFAEATTAASESTAQLRTLTAAADEPASLQSALVRWFLELARSHALAVAVDDVHRADEPSIALLASLAHAGAAGLLVLVTADAPACAAATGALRVLLDRCQRKTLAPLTADQTETLFTSVFGNVPHVTLVSHRIHQIAAGNPRESLALAEHMLDRGLIAYEEGAFTLPARLEVGDLPASVEEAVAARLARLPPMARRLLQVQALCVYGAFTGEDYAVVAGRADPQQLEQALSELIARDLVTSDGVVHTLVNPGWANAIVEPLSPDERAERHRALAEKHARRGDSDLLAAYHLLSAGLHDRALDCIANMPEEMPVTATRADGRRRGLPHVSQKIGWLLERARELAEAAGRPAREVSKLHVFATRSALVTDDAVFYRASACWLARIELDSGLADYRALGDGVPAGQRLQQALQQAMARYERTAEAQRVYRVDEAIRALASYVLLCIVFGTRALDTRLLRSLPELLEPFVPLSPDLQRLHQNTLATCEAAFCAQPRRAFARWVEVYAQLDALPEPQRSSPNAHGMRMAIAHALGEIQANAGQASALRWIEVLDAEPTQAVNAMYLRRIVCLQQADAEGAEVYRRQAEVLAVQGGSRQMFDPPLRIELVAHYMARDLTSLKQVVDRIEERAGRYPGWSAHAHLAAGCFHRLRGDVEAARVSFESCVAASSPDREDPPPLRDVWLRATAGFMSCLIAQGGAREALHAGERALERCRELEIDGWTDSIARELALAEAQLGACERAAVRLDALIADQQQLGVTGLQLGVNYEARARVAIAAHDAEAATRYAQLAANEYQHGRSSNLAAHYAQLLDDARRAGLAVAAQVSGFESSVLGNTGVGDQESAAVARALASARDARSQPERALALLCETGGAIAGHLYLVQSGGLLLHAAAHGGGAADGELDRYAEAYFGQQLEDAGMTAGLTVGTQMHAQPASGAWTDSRGTLHHLLLISCKHRGSLVYVGLALLQLPASARPSHGALALTSAIGAQLLAAGAAAGCTI
jgi:tRNA A-37 threonylcarbamoyl transferase component Bud32